MKRILTGLGVCLVAGALSATSVFARYSAPVTGVYSNNGIQVEFMAEGYHVVTTGGRVGVVGQYKVDGDKISFKDVAGPMGCVGIEGTYSFTKSDAGLSFTKVSDACEGRVGAVDGVTWTRVQ